MSDIHDMEDTGLGMSNFDHEIDDGLETALCARPNEVHGTHAAWNFCGYVWFDGKQFCEEVWRFNAPVEVIKADTLKDLMSEVNDQYGSR